MPFAHPPSHALRAHDARLLPNPLALLLSTFLPLDKFATEESFLPTQLLPARRRPAVARHTKDGGMGKKRQHTVVSSDLYAGMPGVRPVRNEKSALPATVRTKEAAEAYCSRLLAAEGILQGAGDEQVADMAAGSQHDRRAQVDRPVHRRSAHVCLNLCFADVHRNTASFWHRKRMRSWIDGLPKSGRCVLP